MTLKKAVGVIYHTHMNYLDHLAPLCSLFEIPLIVSEDKIFEAAKKYYPNLEVILHSDYITFYQNLSKYDLVFSCQFPYSDTKTISFLQSYNKDLKLIWLPHGNSDKGWINNVFSALKNEKITLVYGQQMLDAFKKQKVFSKIKNKFIVGNYRFFYYQKNYAFYQKIFKEEIKSKLDPSKKTIFYAPTWNDYESNSSYEKAISILIENLKSFNLIIKPHPNTYIQLGYEMEKIHEEYANHFNICFVKDFPHIFPILEFCDYYLGDMSSIGYDFLLFNKPMFFLNTNMRDSKKDKGLFLFRCGVEIKLNEYEKIYDIIKMNLKEDRKRFSKKRKEIYKYAFGKKRDIKALKKNILKICQ
jgi:teichoic acid glycerol-phosphate primase